MNITNKVAQPLGFISWFKSLSKSDWGFFLLYAQLFIPKFLDVMRAFENRVGLGFLTEFSNTLFLIVALLLCGKQLLARVKWQDITFVLGITAFYFISARLYPNSELDVNKGASKFIWECVLMFLVAVTIDTTRYKQMFVQCARIAILITFLFMYVFITSRGTGMGNEDTGENMDLAYNLLPWVIVLIWQAFESYKLFDVIYAAFAIFLLLSQGTRGPIACLFLFTAAYLIIIKQFKRNYLLKSIIAGLAYVGYFFSDIIALAMMGLCASLGFSTRVFENFLEAGVGIDNTSGRDSIYQDMWRGIMKDNTGFGYGLFADRYMSYESYAHNLELEILVNFGKIGGTILLALMFWYIFKAFKKAWGSDQIFFVTVYFFSSVIMLQFSGSYLQNYQLMFFIGICATVLRSNKQNSIKNFNL